MALIERLGNDLKEALKSGAALKVSTLRMALAAVHNREIEKRSKSKEALSDEEVIDVLRKEVKKRKEAIEIFGGAGREDLKEKETGELEILQVYLPSELNNKELEEIIGKILSSGEKEFGKVMKEAMKAVHGRAEAKRVSEIVKKIIGA